MNKEPIITLNFIMNNKNEREDRKESSSRQEEGRESITCISRHIMHSQRLQRIADRISSLEHNAMRDTKYETSVDDQKTYKHTYPFT